MKSFVKNKRTKTFIDYGLLTAVFIPLLAVMPLLTHAGLPNTADGPVHLMRQVQLNQAWNEGNFYPRWGTDLALGYGMPIFSYAPPFLYQLTQLFHLTGLPLDESTKATLVFDFFLYSIGMFLLARRLYGPAPALLAAAVYVYAPYRLREAYIQGNYGQFSGLAFYPLIFWAFHAVITDGRPRYIVAAAVALAGLLFSHNISFMLFAPMFAAYLVFLLGLRFLQTRQGRTRNSQSADFQSSGSSLPVDDRHPAPHKPSSLKSQPSNPPTLQSSILPSFHSSILTPFLRTTFASLLGLGLAAIFWLPAFGERRDIKLEGITQGFFDFRENFISLSELLAPPKPLDLAAINPEFSFSLGLAQIAGAVLGILALIAWTLQRTRQASNQVSVNSEQLLQQSQNLSAPDLYPSNRPIVQPSSLQTTLFFTTFLFLYAFLALPYSQPLWESVPLIELAEFPWRMLGPAIFCASILAAAGFAWVLQLTDGQPPLSQAPSSTRQSSISNLQSPITNLQLLITLTVLLLIITLNAPYLYPSQFIPWGTPSPTDGFAYEASSGAIGTTSTGEFLPRWARQHPEAGTLWPDYEARRPPQKIDPATVPAGAVIETQNHRSESDSLAISTPRSFVATLRTLYWPGWQVFLNNKPVSLTITEPRGLIQVEVPAGQHRLDLRLESTPLRTTGLWLTTAAFLTLLAIGTGLTKRFFLYEELCLPSGVWTSKPRLKPSFFAIIAVTLMTLYFFSRPLEPLFVLRSNPNQPQPADHSLQVDFGDQLRLVGADELPDLVTLPARGSAGLSGVLYWRALQNTDANYSIFLHLDAPNGETFATIDEVNPADIPTRNWPPGLYLRHPLRLEIPASLPPIRYDLTTGVYDRETGRRLPIEPDGATAYTLTSVWLDKPIPQPAALIPLATFDSHIKLYKAEWADGTVTLLWQTDQAINSSYNIFIHALDQAGNIISQADGVPFNGLYPLPNWRPGQLIQDVRTLALDQPPAQLAIGIYDPATGQRLFAVDAENQTLPDNSLHLAISPQSISHK